MANQQHLTILKQGAKNWNNWRYKNSDIVPDLRGADLTDQFLKGVNLEQADLREANLRESFLPEANLREANLRGANLHKVDFEKARLTRADLSEADLSEAMMIDAYLPNANLSQSNLSNAYLRQANLNEANLLKATLYHADLSYANLSKAILSGVNLENSICTDTDFAWANLEGANLAHALLSGVKFHWANLRGANLTDTALINASLIETDLANADISRSWVYGVSVWNPNLQGVIQRDLVITSSHIDASKITVDNLGIAQFIYLLSHNEEVRDVIETIGRKAVLILGRFTPERKVVLDALREELRKRNYIPILFDFEKPDNRDITETVGALAHLSRFVIADLTDPSSIPHELMSFVPDLPSVAVQPVIMKGQRAYAMFEHLQRYQWVLPVYEYETLEEMIAEINEKIIQPAEGKASEMQSS